MVHQLITIPASHYCERARWALDYAGIPFEERKWPPLLHYLDTVPAGGKTVPVLKCPSTATQKAIVLKDSADVVRYAHEHMMASPRGPPSCPLYPSEPDELREVHRLEELFARKLGVWARVVAYHHLFPDQGAALDTLALRQGPPEHGPDPRPGSAHGSPGLAAWKAGFARRCFPLLRGAIVKGLRVSDGNAAACLARIKQLFGEVGDRLEKDGRGYLVGGRFTAADLTFASMAAILLVPPAYGAYLPPLETWPPSHPGWELRSTTAGRHALRMFELHRTPLPASEGGVAQASRL